MHHRKHNYDVARYEMLCVNQLLSYQTVVTGRTSSCLACCWHASAHVGQVMTGREKQAQSLHLRCPCPFTCRHKSSTMAPRPIVRIGVDFGTSMSGYSYATCDDPARVHIPQRWTARDNHGMPKTVTALLFRVNSWTLDCWGTEAVQKYQELQQHDVNSYVLIKGKQFKLALCEGADGLTASYDLPRGCPYTPQQLITMMLKCLKEHADVNVPWPSGSPSTCDVFYCLSVPAGW